MMKKQVLVLSGVIVVSFLSVSACSDARSATRASPAVATVNSRTLFDAAMAALRDPANLALVKGQSLASFYHTIQAAATDETVAIDGVSVGSTKQRLAAGRADFLSFGERYVTVGAYWQATGFDPAAVSFASFQKNMDAAVAFLSKPSGASSSASGSLALLDKYVPVHNDVCDPQHDLVSKWYNGVSLASVACAVTAQKTAGVGSVGAVANVMPRMTTLLVSTLSTCMLGVPVYVNGGPVVQTINIGNGMIRKPAVIAGYGGLASNYFDTCFEPEGTEGANEMTPLVSDAAATQ